jgi:hypothetical protein
MTRKGLFVAITLLLVVAMSGCKRKLKLEGKVTGLKPGSTSTLLVHVVSERRASIECEPPGYSCPRTDIPFNGETDIEVATIGAATQKKIFLKGVLGPKENRIVVDPAASLPPAVLVAFNGLIECVARDCDGVLEIAPAGSLRLRAPAGTIVEVGSDKLTVGASGNIDSPVNITPAVKDQLLSKLCTDKVTFGSSTLSLTFPDKKKATTKFDLTTEHATPRIIKMLEGVSKGPVLFPWEKGAAVRGKGGALYLPGSGCVPGGATDATLADVRVVVLSELRPPRTGECSYTSDSGSKGTAKLLMHDKLVTVYDRGTGRKLGTKLFEAPKFCDPNVTAKRGDLPDQDEFPSQPAIVTFGATFAR